MKAMTRQGLPRGVFALGFVSLFMDTSSEMIHSLLPVFLVSVLGASALAVGVIEGIAEGATAAVKVFAGAVSDRSGRRKPLLVLGYGLAALTKPLFPLATGVGMVFAARLIDRIGKGIRGAPRDALVADITPLALRGAAYGLRQSLDTVGAFVGPALGLHSWPRAETTTGWCSGSPYSRRSPRSLSSSSPCRSRRSRTPRHRDASPSTKTRWGGLSAATGSS